MIAGYVDTGNELDKAMSHFAFTYADQKEIDYQELKAAAKSGGTDKEKRRIMNTERMKATVAVRQSYNPKSM